MAFVFWATVLSKKIDRCGVGKYLADTVSGAKEVHPMVDGLVLKNLQLGSLDLENWVSLLSHSSMSSCESIL